MKKILSLILFLSFWLIFNKSILASDNIFGLHLSQTEDIHTAASIINSQNGDWGWVTIVITTDRLDKNTWQDFFNNCRKDHLIPILRIATYGEKDYWKIPTYSDIDNIVSFLNSLNWPTKEQHVILFNEINHGSEWGGAVDIKDFVDKSSYAAKKFKEANPNFFILSAGLDLAAPSNPPQFESAQNTYKQILAANPNYFDNIDGLTSHSYPDNGYQGTPKDTGQYSILGYTWELNLLKKLGVTKDLPVFITETGWPHREGIKPQNNYYTTKTTADFLVQSINVWSTDPRVKAITPFIYNYCQEPFDHFSWLDKNSNLYPQYQNLIDLPKNKNYPDQITSYEFQKISLPFFILENNQYSGEIILENTGQSIWGEKKFCLPAKTSPNITVNEICSGNDLVYPGQLKIFKFNFTVNKLDNFKDKTFISWGDLENFEIEKFSQDSIIYHSNYNFFQKIINSFKTFFYLNN